MLAPMSAKTESDTDAKNSPSIMRAEVPLLIGLTTAAIFVGVGSQLNGKNLAAEWREFTCSTPG
jgi:hypothetical protein